jgi:hypothetical protein
MSAGRVCDHCGETIVLNRRGDADNGEDAAWLRLEAADEMFDLCTRACVVAFLDRDEVIKAMDAHTESITGIARSISGADDEAGDDA